MANTRKTTTKAKSKSAKKPGASRPKTSATRAKNTKATAKSAASKAKKKAVAKKSVAKKTTAKALKASSSKIPTVAIESLRSLHRIKVGITLLLAVLAGFLMSSASYAATIGYLAKDELLSLTTDQTVFVGASQAVADIELRWIVVVVMILSALVSLLAITRRRAAYEAGVTAGVSKLRWYGSGVISAFMIMTVMFVAGVSNLVILAVLGCAVLLSALLSWVTEKRFKQAGRPVLSEYILAQSTVGLAWIVVLFYAIFTWTHGLVRYTWFVYALIAAVLAGTLFVGRNQYTHMKQRKNYIQVERNYILIALATQVAFAGILIAAFWR